MVFAAAINEMDEDSPQLSSLHPVCVPPQLVPAYNTVSNDEPQVSIVIARATGVRSKYTASTLVPVLSPQEPV